MRQMFKRYLEIFLLILVSAAIAVPSFLLAAKDEVRRGMIGISLLDVSEANDMFSGLNLTKQNGSVVVAVDKDQPADRAGVRIGDLIVEINGKKIQDTKEVLKIIATMRIGEKFTVKVIREEREKQLNITVAERSDKFLRSLSPQFSELLKEPILSLETGMHTSVIKKIGVDRENHWLVTSSYDKTVRLWELPSGRLVRVIRPPVGEGDEGKLYAVAISPDGRQIACGGWTGWTWKGSFNVYLFDAITGHLTGQIMGLPEVMNHLAYSPDGSYIAVCLGGNNGVRIYRCADLRLIGEDKDYRGAIYGADFAHDGHLVTTSLDGYLRLYSQDFHLIAKKKAPGGSEPSHVSFSPNRGKIAVGFIDSTRINVLSGQDLSHLYSPNTEGITDGNLSSVSWSDDGHVIYAGGQYDNGTVNKLILKWADAGHGKCTSMPGAFSTIMDILPLKNGGFVYGSADPALGIYDGADRRQVFLTPDVADYRALLKNLLLSFHGEQVQFGYEFGGKSTARFSIATRRLESDFAHDDGLAQPRMEAWGLSIKDWKNDFYPKLNGRPLILEKHETSRSLAIAPGDGSFLLGTEWRLLLFDREGREKWNIPIPTVAWAVNISGNGRLAVAALADGTIRWYSIADGKELLAFFPHKDRKRWVMWTPEGFFDASEGGARLVGYHLNQGIDKEAIFIPMDNLYDVFYRPDIVATKFKGEDITPLITLTAKEALKNPPPTAEFTTKQTITDKTSIKVCYRISSKGGGIGEVRLFHNAKLIKSDGHYREYTRSKEVPVQMTALNSRAIQKDQKRGIQMHYKEQSVIVSATKGDVYEDCADIETVPGENEIAVAAFNKDNTVQGFLETMTFNANVAPVEPRVYVLIAGIDHYQERTAKLNYAVKDAVDVHRQISLQLETLFKKEQIHTMILINEQVTRTKMLSSLKRLANEIRPGDYFILFTAGHGVLIQNQYYLLTHDYRGDLDAYCMISSNEIVEATKMIKSLNQLLIFDTCHAGGMDSIVSGLYDARMAVIAKKMGLHIYASASSLEGAMDGYKGNGLFTYHLLRGLDNNSEADTNRDAQVSIVELGAYTKKQTIDASGKVGHRQTPMIINFGKDSPIYKLQ